MSIPAKIKTEQVVEDISQELNSTKKVDIIEIKKEASDIKKEASEGKQETKGSHTCAECQKVFKQACNLKTHMALHRGILPFKCSKCEKSFAQKGNCKTHELKCLVSDGSSKSDSNDGKVKKEVISKTASDDLNNLYNSEEESQHEEDIFKAIDNLEKPVKPKVEPPSEDDVFDAIDKLASKPKENDDVLEAIDQLEKTDVKPDISKKFTCEKCSYPAKTKYELDRHVKTKHEGPSYSCTFCNFNTARKENLSLHLKTKHDKFLNLAKEVKKLTENVLPVNLPQNLKLTTVPSTPPSNPIAASITKTPNSVKVASLTKSTANTKTATISKVATITKTSDKAKSATITKSNDYSRKVKDEITEIISITPVTKSTKSEVKEIVSITPVNKNSKVSISTLSQKAGYQNVPQKQSPVKKEVSSKNQKFVGTNNLKLNTPIIKSDGNIWKSNKHSDVKSNVFRLDTSANKSNNLNLFKYNVQPKEETMANLLTKEPIAKFTSDTSCLLPPSPFLPPGSPSVMKVFNKLSIDLVEEDKKPKEVCNNLMEGTTAEVPSKFDDDDDQEDFECKNCMTIFWYKGELNSHLREVHGVKEQNKISALTKSSEIKVDPSKERIATPKIDKQIPAKVEDKSNNKKPAVLKEEDKSKDKKTANVHSCTPCNFKSDRKDKFDQHLKTEKHAQAVKVNDKSSNLPYKRKAEDEAANQNKDKSLKGNTPKMISSSSTLKWPESSKMSPKVTQTKPQNHNDRVAITPALNPTKNPTFNQNRAPLNPTSKVPSTTSQKPNTKVTEKSHGYSGVSITPVVTKLSSANNKTKPQAPVPVVTKLTNYRTAPKQSSVPVVTKLPPNRPPVPVVNKLPNKQTTQIPQKFQKQSVKIQNIKNKITSKVSEDSNNVGSIKITPVLKKRSLPPSSEEPKSKVLKHNTVNINVKDDDDDTEDYSCKVTNCMESFWFPGQLKEHMTKAHKA